jgi:UDP-N-acetylmuramoylalanine--D-glutamate ligase
MPALRVSEPALEAAWREHEIAVIGLGRSGTSVATLLARSGSMVYASDSSDSSAAPGLEVARKALDREGVSVELGAHDVARVARSSLVVVSPGVPPDAPAVVAARSAGIDVVSEVEIALRFMPNMRYVAVTGTNGKTTTTALIAHLLRSLGVRAVAAGNIGTPLSAVALEPQPAPWVVLEVSSFQLHNTPSLRPTVGALTNLSPNHLDRYSSLAEYYADKRMLFRNASPASHWVTNGDEAAVREMADAAAGVRATFSTAGRADAYFERDTDSLVVLGATIMRREELRLLGDHNVANALCAALAVMLAEPAHRAPDAIQSIVDGLRSFAALPHRVEVVANRDGVLYVNDSKSTNVASAIVALRAMSRPTILLMGGRHKGEPYGALEPELRRTVRRVIAYGEAAAVIASDLEGIVAVEQDTGGFADVLMRARRSSKPGDAILLSPACSSFDMFTNYEQRGNEFKRLVAGD